MKAHRKRIIRYSKNEIQLQRAAENLPQEEAWNETGRNIGSGHFAVIIIGQQMPAVQIGQLQTRLVEVNSDLAD